ncbi:MAG: FKBP-type peptidyl-prolyl cis-trans isomerase N-terminal domain-containing protein, partial [Planctomycetota bacterium]
MTVRNTQFSSDTVSARSVLAVACLCFLWALGSPRAVAQAVAEPLQTPTALSSPSPARADDVTTGLNTPEGTLGYALGLRIGARITADFKAQHAPINPEALARGLADAILGRKPLLGEEQLSQALEVFEKKMQEQELAFGRRMAEVAKVNKVKAAAFLEA